ncbi:metallophosphoesterase family protein [Pelagibacterium sp. H642]|uniref:metallophosphoesterase family protein n=1 Tax=Pelagibacterium sp. H642 TaxID=1881069 RepID=UPI0028166F92|nr:metallophosphoesterase family protein [Pelagibacterium sp. H642]WMT92549.1 serine/threonine protein phosphatase [Pelagibacterium sp. H642]
MSTQNAPIHEITITARSPLAVETSGTLGEAADDTAAAQRIYAVGDLHGHLDLLKAMLRAIRADIDQHSDMPCTLVFLGDYIDRGPNSRGILDLLSAGLSMDRCATVFLRGNHEQWLEDFVRGEPVLSDWAPKGGLQTLGSYGLSPELILKGCFDKTLESEIREQFLSVLPQAHRQFILDLGFFYSTSQYFFAHAGVDPDKGLEDQRSEDLTWIRYKFLRSQKDFGKVVVHGHTPAKAIESLPNRINVDTGVDMYGRLSCVILEAGRRYGLEVFRERSIQAHAPVTERRAP